MTAAEKRIIAFCTRCGLACKWEAVKCNGRRAVIETQDKKHHDAMLAATHRLKDVCVTDWACGAGGFWEGRIYLQDAADAKRITGILSAEYERCQNWNQVYHDCILAGLSPSEASHRAEALFPTPTVL